MSERELANDLDLVSALTTAVLSGYIRSREEELPDRVVEASGAVAPTGGKGPTIMVALSNPRTEGALITLAGILSRHKGGRVLATHIVTVPDQTSLETAAANRARIDASSEELLNAAKADIELYDVPIETTTVLSHRGIEAVFDTAKSHNVDTVVMGYGGAKFTGGRVEHGLSELTSDLPCDCLVLNGEELDLSDVLIPTAGGPSSDLSAEIATALQETVGVELSLLHLTEAGNESDGEAFLRGWAGDHGLDDAELLIETGDFETVIKRLGEQYSLVIIGASERGLLSRIIRGTPTVDTIETLDTPVLLTERASSRSLLARLFG